MIEINNDRIEGAILFAIIVAFGIIVAKLVSMNVRRSLAEKIPVNELNLILKVVNFSIIAIFALIALPFL